jgi:hypothetical protein
MNKAPGSGREPVSVGKVVGQALAERLVDLSRPGEIIIDNSATTIRERRRSQRRASVPSAGAKAVGASDSGA